MKYDVVHLKIPDTADACPLPTEMVAGVGDVLEGT